MSRFNKLLHGDLDTLVDLLENDCGPLTQTEMRLVLTNLIQRAIRRHADACATEDRLQRIECRLDRLDAVAASAGVWPRLGALESLVRTALKRIDATQASAEAAADDTPASVRNPYGDQHCELRWCIGGRDLAGIRVSEVSGDGAYSVFVCQVCADAIGAREGDTLPEPAEVRRRLEKAVHGRLFPDNPL